MAQMYKMCASGHLTIFEESAPAPRRCAECGRDIFNKSILPLADYKPPKDEEEKPEDEPAEDGEAEGADEGEVYFKLVNEERNIEIVLPEEEFILGREGVGADVLPSTVSRKHLYVAPKGRMGLRVIDKGSLNGTLIEGKTLPKDTYRMVLAGQSITLDVNSTGITLKLKRCRKEKEE